MAVLGRARTSMGKLREKLRPPAPDAPAPYTYAMHTHVGRVRKGNEDTCAASPEAGAFVVCDGMGGAAAGEVASRLAADTFLSHMTPFGDRTTPRTATPDVRMQAAIEAANEVVFKRSRKSREMAGMGTTLVALHVELRAETASAQRLAALHNSNHLNPLGSEPRPASATSQRLAARSSAPPPSILLTLAHVGDSRCYLFRDNTLTPLTVDHSVVQEQIMAGEITPAQAELSPLRNIITRAVGSQPEVLPDIQHLDPRPADIYLLCSDGLTRDLADRAIETSLRRATRTGPPDLAQACRTLIDEANELGGGDNITVLLFRVS